VIKLKGDFLAIEFFDTINLMDIFFKYQPFALTIHLLRRFQNPPHPQNPIVEALASTIRYQKMTRSLNDRSIGLTDTPAVSSQWPRFLPSFAQEFRRRRNRSGFRSFHVKN